MGWMETVPRATAATTATPPTPSHHRQLLQPRPRPRPSPQPEQGQRFSNFSQHKTPWTPASHRCPAAPRLPVSGSGGLGGASDPGVGGPGTTLRGPLQAAPPSFSCHPTHLQRRWVTRSPRASGKRRACLTAMHKSSLGASRHSAGRPDGYTEKPAAGHPVTLTPAEGHLQAKHRSKHLGHRDEATRSSGWIGGRTSEPW